MKKYKKILKIALNVFIWIFVVFSVFMTVLALAAQSNADGVPAIGGKCFLTVASNSMSPTFEEDDLIFGEMLTVEEKQTLQKGDVITFYADLDGNGSTELNSHRIVDFEYDANGKLKSYITKGDNTKTNVIEDDPVQWQFVIAKWSGKRIAGIGGVLSFLQTPKGFLIAIVLPLVLFFLYELYCFLKALLAMKAKKAEAPAISAEQEEAIKQKAIEEYLKQQQEQQAEQQEERAPTPPAAEEIKETEAADNADSDQ